MLGPKLFVLLFLAFMADAQYRRPPPRRLSNGPVGNRPVPRPITTNIVEIDPPPEPSTPTPKASTTTVIPQILPINSNQRPSPRPKIPKRPNSPIPIRPQPFPIPPRSSPNPKSDSVSSNPHVNTTRDRTESTSKPGIIIVYPEGTRPEEYISDSTFSLVPNMLPAPQPDPEPQPDQPDLSTRYPIIDFGEYEPESKPQPDPELQPDVPDLTTRYPIIDFGELEPEREPQPDAKPQPKVPDFTTRYPIIDFEELEPESNPQPEPEPQPNVPDFNTQYPIIDFGEFETESKPQSDPEPQPDKSDSTTRNSIIDFGEFVPESKLQLDPERQPDVPDYTTRYPIIDFGELDPETKPQPNPEDYPRPNAVPSSTDNLKPFPPNTFEPTYPTQKPVIPSKHVERPLNPYIPSQYPYPSRPIDGYRCRQVYAYYAVPNECDTYIECRESIAMKHSCPGGLLYNSKAIWPVYPCVYPSEVKCHNKTIIHDPKPNGECPQQFGTFPARSGDCEKYIVCHHGRANLMSCPRGLAFNPTSNGCDWPEKVPNCNPTVFQDFTCPTPPMDQNGMPSTKVYNYSYRNSCKEYIACLKGEPRLLRCDSGLHFDAVTRHCIDADKVKHCGPLNHSEIHFPSV